MLGKKGHYEQAFEYSINGNTLPYSCISIILDCTNHAMKW